MKEIKELSEVMHLYLGCEVYDSQLNEYGILSGVSANGHHQITGSGHGTTYTQSPEFIKLRLRRLSSMTEEEARKLIELRGYPEVTNIQFQNGGVTFDHPGFNTYINFEGFNPGQFSYLLSKGFWLFGDDAFEKGLIIDTN